jgi:hypothetical protein
MAKGDDAKVRNQIGQNNQTMSGIYNPMIGQMQGNYGVGSGNAIGGYDEIMQGYRDLLGSPAGSLGGGGYGVPADQFKSYAGYEDFAKTGGFSPADIANMRARSSSQVRANYANAEREMSRQRALQGGYSPNFMAASAKMAREQSQGNADAVQNTNAGLAQMIQQGKLSGLQGMTPIEQMRMQMAMQAAASGASSGQNDINNRFRALAGMQGLYGTTPGMAQLFGNQALTGAGQYGNYLNQSAGQQTMGAQLPGNWDTTMNRIGDIGNIASGVLSAWRG